MFGSLSVFPRRSNVRTLESLEQRSRYLGFVETDEDRRRSVLFGDAVASVEADRADVQAGGHPLRLGPFSRRLFEAARHLGQFGRCHVHLDGGGFDVGFETDDGLMVAARRLLDAYRRLAIAEGVVETDEVAVLARRSLDEAGGAAVTLGWGPFDDGDGRPMAGAVYRYRGTAVAVQDGNDRA